MGQSQTKALIALGGNIGNVDDTMRKAAAELNAVEKIEVWQLSNIYSTQPIGSNAGNPFLNAALTIETSLTAEALLDEMQRIENKLGRIRNQHWGPRVIDLDLVLYGDSIIQTERLTVPHPACFYRRFVLDPATEIAGDWVHPCFGFTLEQLLSRLSDRPLLVSVLGDAELLEQLEQTCDTTLSFTDSATSASALIFHRGEASGFPQGISLEFVADRFSYVQQVLLAAVDQPKVVDRGG